MLSTLLCGCRAVGAPNISLVNEVQCGTGTEWRDLIGQQSTPAATASQMTLARSVPSPDRNVGIESLFKPDTCALRSLTDWQPVRKMELWLTLA